MIILLQTNATAFLTLVLEHLRILFRFWEFAQGLPWFQFGMKTVFTAKTSFNSNVAANFFLKTFLNVQ